MAAAADDDAQRRQELSGAIAAGVDRVWEVLTTAHSIGVWCRTFDAVPVPHLAAVDLRPGGSFRAGMRSADYEQLIRLSFEVVEVETPIALTLRSTEGYEAQIQFTLTGVGEAGTRLQVAISSKGVGSSEYLKAWSEILLGLRASVEGASGK